MKRLTFGDFDDAISSSLKALRIYMQSSREASALKQKHQINLPTMGNVRKSPAKFGVAKYTNSTLGLYFALFKASMG